ncbi:MAG: B3/B4 domain-containing protein [Rhizobiaceae bacterium]
MSENAPTHALLLPQVDQAIFKLRPDFQLVSINVSHFQWSDTVPVSISAFVKNAEEQVGLPDPERDAHLMDWREAYRAFGAKPKRTLSSAEALVKRASRDGALPKINTLVDIYNAVSILHGLPVGGEDRARYAGHPRLIRADGTEGFETTKAGEPHVEHPQVGEVIWRDEIGVTCRRWNWRQGARTRIEQGASELWFVLEALASLPDKRLTEATQQMVDLIQSLSPAAVVETLVIEQTSPAVPD